MGCGDAKMMEGFPFVKTLSTTYDEEVYERNFFGGLVSTTAPVSSASSWDSEKTDYQIGDVVLIDDLKTEYICGEVANMDYPPSSSSWLPKTANDYRQIDNIPTTKTTSTEDIVNVYDVFYANYIVGHFIDGVDTVIVETLEDDMQTVKDTLSEIKMTEIIDYTCFSCCNPPPAVKRYFYLNLEEKKCATKYIKVTFKKRDNATEIKIGTVAVVRAIDAGYPDFDTRVSIDNGIEFQRVGITKDIHAVNMGATITLNGEARIGPAAKKKLYKKLMEYQGLTFTIFDIPELEVLDGVIMGKFSAPDGLQIGVNLETTYNFKKEGVLA